MVPLRWWGSGGALLPLLMMSLAVWAEPTPPIPQSKGVDPATLHALATVVAARVEQHAGARFSHLPEVVLTRSDALAMARAHRSAAEAGSTSESQRVLEHARASAALSRHVGLYMHDEDRIFLFEDNIQTYAAEPLGPHGLLEPYLVCTLAHELTHALQFQVAGQPRPANPMEAVVTRSLREGHANLVGEAVCTELGEPAVIGFDRGMQGIDVLASRPRTLPELGEREDGPLLVQYGYGQLYIETVVQAGGPTEAWEVLRSPDITLGDLLEGGLAGLPPDIRTPALSALLAQILLPDCLQAWSEDQDTIDILGPLGPEGLARIPSAVGAWTRERRDPEGRGVRVSVIHFEDASHPSALLHTLLRQPALVPWTPEPRLSARTGVDGIVARRLPDESGEERIVWVSDGADLIVISLTGPSVPNRRLRSALRSLHRSRARNPAPW